MRVWFIVTAILVSVGLASSASAGRRKKLTITVKKADVDLENRILYFRINRPADSAELKVYSPEGELLAERTELYNGAAARTRLKIGWPQLLGKNTDNFRLELRVTDVDEYWIGWQVVRFYLEIPHEDVVFETAKWDIRPSEAHKLDAALKLMIDTIKKYGKLVECELYIAGHTDTVGSISRKEVEDLLQTVRRFRQDVEKWLIANHPSLSQAD